MSDKFAKLEEKTAFLLNKARAKYIDENKSTKYVKDDTVICQALEKYLES